IHSTTFLRFSLDPISGGGTHRLRKPTNDSDWGSRTNRVPIVPSGWSQRGLPLVPRIDQPSAERENTPRTRSRSRTNRTGGPPPCARGQRNGQKPEFNSSVGRSADQRHESARGRWASSAALATIRWVRLSGFAVTKVLSNNRQSRPPRRIT